MSSKGIWDYAYDDNLEKVKKRVQLKGPSVINTEKGPQAMVLKS